MTKYTYFNKTRISGISDKEIVRLYDQGYVLTRLPEQMNQVKSLRIGLKKFELNSENRRILRKTEQISFFDFQLPLPKDNTTNWQIFNLGKNFYQEKFNEVDFSANKIRELIYNEDPAKLRFNGLFAYYVNNTLPNNSTAKEIDHTKTLGYCIVYRAEKILHYCYPFYNLTINQPNLGMGMMLKAIIWAKESGYDYVYLGSFSRPNDTYKLQFNGVEWWDGKGWSSDLNSLKITLD